MYSNRLRIRDRDYRRQFDRFLRQMEKLMKRNELNLYRITSGHFVAGFEADVVVRQAAPIIQYMVGWRIAKAERYIAQKGWTLTLVEKGDPITVQTLW